MRSIPPDLARAALNAAPDAMVITDEHGIIMFVNCQTEMMFGYQRQELQDKSVEILLPERLRQAHPAHRDSFRVAPRVRPMGADLELHARRRDGSEFNVEISLSPLPTDEGLLVCSAIRDVTDRKHLLEQLKIAKQEADKANRAKSAFLAAASHDLRQPLQTLMLLCNVLEKTATDSRAVEAAATQRDALEAMSALVNSLLDISRFDAGSIQPRIDDFPVQLIFRQLKAALEGEAQEKGLALIVDECMELVRSDHGLLEQIVQNLVANAIRYTEKGFVQLRCVHDGESVRIEVIDTGIGIPESQRVTIFEEFCQLNREPGNKREGLGLGLAIVRRIAQLLGHIIAVESTVGRGSCFSVTVPYAGRTRFVKEHPIKRKAVKKNGLILLVDDDIAIAKATKLLLELEGHDVLATCSLEEALLTLGKMNRQPDLLVSDFHLGNSESGLEVIQEVRHLTGNVVPALLITGDTSTQLADAAIRAQCEVLSKPVIPDDFLHAVERLLSDTDDMQQTH